MLVHLCQVAPRTTWPIQLCRDPTPGLAHQQHFPSQLQPVLILRSFPTNSHTLSVFLPPALGHLWRPPELLTNPSFAEGSADLPPAQSACRGVSSRVTCEHSPAQENAVSPDVTCVFWMDKLGRKLRWTNWMDKQTCLFPSGFLLQRGRG